jgi:hypothetical protein
VQHASLRVVGSSVPGSKEREMDRLQQRVAALERRLQELEAGERRVQAPFQVVDTSGRPLLEVSVDERGPKLRLFNTGGQEIALLGTLKNEGALLLRNAQGELIAILGSTPEGGFLDIRDDEGDHAAVVTADADTGHVMTFEEGGLKTIDGQLQSPR